MFKEPSFVVDRRPLDKSEELLELYRLGSTCMALLREAGPLLVLVADPDPDVEVSVSLRSETTPLADGSEKDEDDIRRKESPQQ